MTTTDPRRHGRAEGERLHYEAIARHEANRRAYLSQARRALLTKLLQTGIATADDVAEIGSGGGIDPRWRGAVPTALVEARIIVDSGRAIKSCRPEAHARKITVWQLADRQAAQAWLDRNPSSMGSFPAPAEAQQPL